MAQGRVTEYFSARKRPLDFQPSKRRKVQGIAETVEPSVELPEVKKTTPVSRRTRARAVNKVAPPADLNVQLQQPVRLKGKDAGPKIKTPATKARTKGRSKKTQATKGDIGDILKHLEDGGSKESEQTETDNPSSESVGEEVTAACDDHIASPPGTPTKRSQKSDNGESDVIHGKRSRHAKSVRKDILKESFDGFKTPEKPEAFDFSKFADGKVSIKKKLVLKAERKGPSDCQVDPGILSSQLKSTSNQSNSSENGGDHCQEGNKEEQSNDNNVEEEKTQEKTKKSSTAAKSKSKAKTKAGKNSGEGEVELLLEASSTKTTSKSDSALKSLDLDKLNTASVKDKLSKCGKLEELQAKLAQFSEKVAKVNQMKKEQQMAAPDKKETESTKKEKAPAYERFHSLAQPVPPSLSLPFQYKLLQDMFNSMEVVVSMLYNRHEICSFTKLKKAIEQMLRKAFEEKNLGQIKEVYPTAYILRQEGGLPVYGGKKSGFQLTVEPNLQEGDAPTQNILDKNGRPAFTATKLLERKERFHRLLINIVKRHHKEFLSKMDRPLSIPDEKITRWHPRFALDEVPSIEASPLPQPPDVKKFNTAQEVLDQAKNQIHNPRVKKALELMAMKSASRTNSPGHTPSKLEKNILNSPGASPKVNKGKSPVENLALKGVSSSLLERIRAKETVKQELSMMRTPEDEKRLSMMNRLPEIIRIMRLFFVTQKKPALPYESVCQKVMDSYRSSLGIVEAESHIKMIVDLVPEWVKVVQISKGRYVQLDRNKDVAAVINKVQMIENQAK